MNKEFAVYARNIAIITAIAASIHAAADKASSDPAKQSAIDECRADQSDPAYAKNNPDKVVTGLQMTQNANLRAQPNASNDSLVVGRLSEGQVVLRAYEVPGYDLGNNTRWGGIAIHGNCYNMEFFAQKYAQARPTYNLIPNSTDFK